MFLAWKEIMHEKLRYSLIIGMVFLVSYLIFMLTSLAMGLSNENTSAVESWNIEKIALTEDSDINMQQSQLTLPQIQSLNKTSNEAVIGETAVVLKSKDTKKEKVPSSFIGLKDNEFIFKNLKLSEGHKPTSKYEIVVDSSLKNQGYKLNQLIRLNSDVNDFKIVGFIKNAQYGMAPVIYGNLSIWQELRGTNMFSGSAVVSKKSNFKSTITGIKVSSTKEFINKLPGYSAQNSTFALMISFLMIISLVVIAVFLYIITMQKMSNYAVLRAQGIPAKTLVFATISQAFILVISGLLLGVLFTVISASFIPKEIPMLFDFKLLSSVALGLIVISILGALIPVQKILHIDPVTVIGG